METQSHMCVINDVKKSVQVSKEGEVELSLALRPNLTLCSVISGSIYSLSLCSGP